MSILWISHLFLWDLMQKQTAFTGSIKKPDKKINLGEKREG